MDESNQPAGDATDFASLSHPSDFSGTASSEYGAGKSTALSESRDDMRIERARELLASFSRRTGIHAPGDSGRRYLWTDAFAVQALLALSRATGEKRHSADAFRLIDLVHLHLGAHRSDDPRVGWISGLDGPTAESHPTLGGLRIGKPLPERLADAPYDARLEWERDGQYYHYLTRWIRAATRAGDSLIRHENSHMRCMRLSSLKRGPADQNVCSGR